LKEEDEHQRTNSKEILYAFSNAFFDLAFSKPSQSITIPSSSLSYINFNDSARKQANAKSQWTNSNAILYEFSNAFLSFGFFKT
jgi:hypothetical protein